VASGFIRSGSISIHVETVYGNQQGARKGTIQSIGAKRGCGDTVLYRRDSGVSDWKASKRDNGKRQGNSGLYFEYKRASAGCVQAVLLRADGDFLSWKALRPPLRPDFDLSLPTRDVVRL